MIYVVLLKHSRQVYGMSVLLLTAIRWSCIVISVCDRRVQQRHKSHIIPCMFLVTWSPQTVQGSSTFFLWRVFLSKRSISKWGQLHFITTSAFTRTEIWLSDIKLCHTNMLLLLNPPQLVDLIMLVLLYLVVFLRKSDYQTIHKRTVTTHAQNSIMLEIA